MGTLSRETIDEVIERSKILEVVQNFVQLTPCGNNYRGLSPFCNSNSPTFFVLPEKNIFKCFTTGNTGGPVRFLQLKADISFEEAIETLAKKLGVSIQQELSFD